MLLLVVDNNSCLFNVLFLPLLILSLLQHKEMRFLIMLMPFLLILASYGLITVIQCNKKIRIPITYLLIIFVFQSFVNIYATEKTEIQMESNNIMQGYLDNENLGNVWISNPVFAVNSDKKIDTLIYYPTFNQERFDFLNSNLLNADTILLDTCNIECNPKDFECSNNKKQFLSNIENQFKINYNNNYGKCEQYVFVR